MLHTFTLPPRAFSWAVAVVLIGALFAVVALAVHETERNDRQNVREQFQLRADIAETFLHTYVKEIHVRAHSAAVQELSDLEMPETKLEAVSHAFGFKAAVVLDSTGKLIQVHPAKSELLGADLVARYDHLRLALTEGMAVSNIVPSAALGAPVVAIATRYDSPNGPRVFSGAFDVRVTPLSGYIKDLLELNGAHADLLDAQGTIVASNRTLAPYTHPLESVDPGLASALRAGRVAEYETVDGRSLFFQRKVAGTPWRLIISVEEGLLFSSIGGTRRWLPWALFGGFCAASVVAAFLLMQLRAVSQLHARLARVDRLTELPNRLHLDEHMARLVSAAARQGKPFSVFIGDVDHFKRINDTYGHKVGDEVLRALSARMAKALRAEDMLGRWGGEEFLALLPNTNEEGACVVANRVRTMVSSSPIVTTTGIHLDVTISIGCATAAGVRDEGFVQRADEALYSAKKLGRDRVVSSAPPSARNTDATEPLAHGT